MEFKDRLRASRTNAGLTQQQLADRIGVAKSTLAGYEAGTREPDFFKIKKIIDELSVDADYLLGTEKKYVLQKGEQEFIDKYRALDEHGRRVIDYLLNEEIDRLQQMRQEDIPDNAISLLYFPDVISAGVGDYGSQEHQKINLPASKVHRKTDYIVKMHGIAMEPTYYDGDMLCVSRTIAPKVGDIGIFSVGGRNLIRELGNKKLIPHNSNVEDTPITPDVECKGLILSKVMQ